MSRSSAQRVACDIVLSSPRVTARNFKMCGFVDDHTIIFWCVLSTCTVWRWLLLAPIEAIRHLNRFITKPVDLAYYLNCSYIIHNVPMALWHMARSSLSNMLSGILAILPP